MESIFDSVLVDTEGAPYQLLTINCLFLQAAKIHIPARQRVLLGGKRLKKLPMIPC